MINVLNSCTVHVYTSAYRVGQLRCVEEVGCRELVNMDIRPCLPFVTAVMTEDCVHLLYITTAGNAISSQLGSCYQGRRYGTAGQAVRPIYHSTNHSCRAILPQRRKAGRRVGPALYDYASSLVRCTGLDPSLSLSDLYHLLAVRPLFTITPL
jgi:hypothetical protein